MADQASAGWPERVSNAVQQGIHRAVPSHLGTDALGLAGRVFRSGRDGRHTLGFAAMGVAATPVDLALRNREARRYAAAETPRLPLIFVCGAARSGTTLVASSLIRSLPVSYFTNVTAVFPRSPISASALLRLPPDNSRVSDRSLYGRTAGWRGASDALPLWDRWLGPDRHHMPTTLSPEAGVAIRQFFGAYEAWTKQPLVAKNNSLNAVAHLIADALPTARFICVDRDPLFLAQSLLEARMFMYGDRAHPYGLGPGSPESEDPVDSVIAQVRYHRDLADRQRQRLGPNRFWVVDYDEFCAAPNEVTARVATELLETDAAPMALVPFRPSRQVRIGDAEFARLSAALGSGTTS